MLLVTICFEHTSIRGREEKASKRAKEEEKKRNCLWHKCSKIKVFSGTILHGASNEPKALRTQSNIYEGAFFFKKVNNYKPLTVFAKRLYCRYST